MTYVKKDPVVIQANRLFMMCILLEVAGIFVISFTGVEGAQIVIYVATLCYAVRSVIKYGRTKVFANIHIRTIEPGKLLHTIIIAVCGVPVAMLINAFISSLFGQNAGETAEINTVTLFVAIVVYAIVPALVEEFVFRGVIFGAFKKKDVKAGILVSSLFFALLHFSPGSVLYGFLFGSIFAVVYHATENLIYPIMMHLVFNTINVILSYANLEKIPTPVTVGVSIVGSILFAVLAWLFFRREVRWGKERPEILALITKEGYVSMAICLMVMIMTIIIG